MGFTDFLEWLGTQLWGMPFLVFTIVVGVYYVFATKAFSFVHLGHIFKSTFGTLRKQESKNKSCGQVSPWEAVCIAIGGCVGTGNVSGVAAAIALGGPGALFWIWA